jgi:hypothetical protein
VRTIKPRSGFVSPGRVAQVTAKGVRVQLFQAHQAGDTGAVPLVMRCQLEAFAGIRRDRSEEHEVDLSTPVRSCDGVNSFPAGTSRSTVAMSAKRVVVVLPTKSELCMHNSAT